VQVMLAFESDAPHDARHHPSYGTVRVRAFSSNGASHSACCKSVGRAPHTTPAAPGAACGGQEVTRRCRGDPQVRGCGHGGAME
jgi:hypothetical protein